MNRIAGIVLVALVSLTAYGQKSETRQVGPFKGIRTGEAIDVYLKKGDKEAVKVEVDGVSLSDVLTEVSGSYLKIHMREGNYRNRNVKVYVTYVNLEKISSSSASNVFSEGVIKTPSLEINAASAGSVEIQVDAGSITADAASAGDITLEGKTKTLFAEASSAGSIDAYNLDAENVNVQAVSAGSAKVSASKELEAAASSGGSVRYRGNPTKTNTDSSSGGSVKKTS